MGYIKSISVVRQADFNHDGLEDRIIRVFGCRENKRKELQCSYYQVEMGKPGGGYVPVYNPEALLNPEPVEKNDLFYFMPEYYAQRRFVDVQPGYFYPHKAGSILTWKPPLSREGLMDLCSKEAGTARRHACFMQATQDPLDHSLQPWESKLPKGKKFISASLPGADRFDFVTGLVETRFVIKKTPGVLTPEFKQFLRDRQPASEPLKNPLDEYITGSTPGEILSELQNLRTQIKYHFFSAVRGNPTDRTRDYEFAMAHRIEDKFEKNLKALWGMSLRDGKDFIAFLDFLQDVKKDGAGNFPTFSGAPMNGFLLILQKASQDPKLLKPLVTHLLFRDKKEDLGTGRWGHRFTYLVPVLHDLMVKTTKTEDLPSQEQLLQIGSKVSALTAPALVAASNWQRRADEAEPLVERALASLNLKSRLMALYAAPVLLGPRAIPTLLRLSADPLEEIRFTSYEALRKVPPPPAWEGEYVKAFRRGLRDPSLKVQVFAAQTLMDAGDPEVAKILYERLKKYHDHPYYADREKHRPPKIEVLDDSIVDKAVVEGCKRAKPSCDGQAIVDRQNFIEDMKMEVGVDWPQPDGKPARPVTLKSLALAAIGKFGSPLDAGDLLVSLLDEEKDGVDMMLAGQALTKLWGQGALPHLVARMEKGAPEPFYLATLSLIQKAQARELAPKIYPFLIHGNPEIRQASLWALQSFDEKAVLKALIRDSHDQKTTVRLRMAEALGNFQWKPAAARLIEMVMEDSEAMVRKQAALSVSRMERPEILQYLKTEEEKNPALKEKLEALLAQGESAEQKASLG